jgi:ADP-heptose:LPS heptosyltransferase
VSVLVNLGDVVMMTAALDLLRRRFPEARLAVLARPEAAEILAGNPVLDELIVYPYRSGSFFSGLGPLRRRLRAGRYDVFVSLDRRPRGVAAALLAGIGERWGPDRLYAGSRPRFWTRPLFTRIARLTPDECAGSQVEMFQLVIRRLFQVDGRGRITLPPVGPETAARVAGWLDGANGRPVVGFCVKTNDPAKTWPAAGFAALLARLKAELNPFLYLTGAPGDAPYVADLLASFDSGGILNLAGRTSLMDLAGLAARSDLFVGPDNGTAHLTANSGLSRFLCLLVATDTDKVADSLAGARFLTVSGEGAGPDRLRREADRVFEAAAGWLKSE